MKLPTIRELFIILFSALGILSALVGVSNFKTNHYPTSAFEILLTVACVVIAVAIYKDR